MNRLLSLMTRRIFSGRKPLIIAILMPSVLGGCIDNDSDDAATYSAEVVRTEYGIPHVTAHSWGSLGYGYGYAYSQDNFCVMMREIVVSNGNAARYLDGNIDNDFVYKLYNTDEYIREQFTSNADFSDLVAGFTAGANRYLAETGVDGLPEGDEGCRNAEWVRPLNDTDLGKLLRKLTLRASTDPLARLISAQDGPDQPMLAEARRQRYLNQTAAPLQIASAGLEALLPKPEEFGSNAYAIGGNQTTNGMGLLLGNPHFPWTGSNRFYMVHLTIPDEYDVMGASLHGFPLVNVGFNKDIAWSHTVSTGQRFTIYELTVDPSDPLKYIYDGESRDIETETVTAERVLEDGSVETVDHTFYISHFGPIVDLSAAAGVPLLADWPTALGTIYAVRDANLYNTRGFDTWSEMGKATNLDELLQATATIGNPWTNTIAVDSAGNSAYADISTIPHVTQDQFDTCIQGFVAPLLTENGLVTLDGSTSACEWGTDPDSPEPGIMGFSGLPKLVNRDYAANANDSYWLSNPAELLTDFSPIIGREEVEQSLRTRLTFQQAQERIAGVDGLGIPGFDVSKLQQVALSSRNIAAEMTLDDVLPICDSVVDWSTEPLTDDYIAENPDLMPQACTVLSNWDRHSNLESVGAHVFFEFWRNVLDLTGDERWLVAFDATAPVTTPNTLNIGDADVVMAMKTALAQGVDTLAEAGIPLDRPWGQVQFAPRNGENIPIHGSSSAFSFTVISSRLVDGEGYSDIRAGNSYIHTVGWDGSACPDAYAILTYSQSTDPASPHYADMTRLYSAKDWVDMPFCEEDVSAQQISSMLLQSD